MINFLLLILALVTGMGLGIVYFGGLWLTVQQLPKTRHPWLLVTGSLVGRMAIAVAGLAFVMDGHWERLMACLLTFLWVRGRLLQRVQLDLKRSQQGR